MNDSHSLLALGKAGLIAAALCACGMLMPGRAAGESAAVAFDEVRGTIAVHGSDLPADAFRVRVRQLEVQAIGGNTQRAHCDDPVVVPATLVREGEAGRYQFSIKGLLPGVPYQVGLRLKHWGRGRAPRLVWSSDRRPVVRPGDPELQFDGYAVRSQIEVMGAADRAHGRSRARWVGADGLDFTEANAAARTFRWRTTLPDITGGRLQVSVRPFPRVAQPDYSPCNGDDSGLLYTQDFPVEAAGPSRWTTLPPVDFNALIYRSGRTAETMLPGTVGPAALDPNFETLTLPKLEAGMPLYVRVLPMRGDVVVCDPDDGGVPPEVLIALIKKLAEIISDPQVSVENVSYSFPTWAPVESGRTYFRITKDHKLPDNYPFGYSTWEFLALYTGYGPGQTIPEGAGFWFKPGSSSSSWIEDFAEGLGAIFTGIVDGLGDLVNYASKLWEDIQDGVVNAVADTLVSLGLPCDDQCRALLETGLEIGLASMGVPPSLPNFEELTDQGLEYLADQAVAQFAPGVPVPDFVKDYATDQAKQFVKGVAQEMRSDYGVSGLPDWLAPDIRFQPASLTMDLYGAGKTQPFNSQPGISRLNTPIYGGAFVKLPRHLPEKGVEPPLVFPMVLPANFANLAAPPGKPSGYARAIWDRDHWIKARFLPTSACYHLHLTALSDPGGIYKIFDVAFRPSDAKPCTP